MKLEVGLATGVVGECNAPLYSQEVTHIAVTRGPGLAPCLAAGLAFAKKLALEEK